MAEEALNQIGYQKLTVADTAVALTLPTGLVPRRMIVRAEGTSGTNDVRWRADGSDPTATDGMLLPATSVLDLTDPMMDYSAIIKRSKWIRVGAASGTIHVAYFA